MLIDVIPKLQVSAQIVDQQMIDGYNLVLPDRIGFLYAMLSEDRKTLISKLAYKGSQYTLSENNYICVDNNEAIHQCFRKYLIDASQVALTIMYE